ncbi:protein PAT1 homolog 2-like isoform X2 [Sinocyclocheilus anshuiensis]|uniref:protein PAT1 homolog 2-like isoform X2 n=1 Tax=Sinocyclocheilus anshuiensis TaxID=1608454 RepID=UPI0007B9CCB7|nr:PREDICTED: protein PAT1 homolog 2-like isoform X2 [Sinocyclocheilus anshuiensis]
MGDSEHPEKTGESVPDASWPENGDQWSDKGEEEDDDECGLLQEMVEEDEEIDLYNEETFGLATSGDNPDADPLDLLLLCSDNSSTPPPPQRSPSPRSSHSPSRPGSRVWPHTPTGRSQRGRAGRGQLFDDPAVVKTVEGRPSLKSLDSAIVDCSLGSYWEDPKSNTWMIAPLKSSRPPAASLLQDQAIVGVIDGSRHGRVPPVSPNFLSPMRPFSTSRGRRGLPFVGSFNQRCHYQAQKNPMVPCSPFRPQRLFSPQQQYNQPGGFLSPSRPPPLSIPMPDTHKLMHLQFGTDSPRPAPFYSPSSNTMQGFRAPGPVAQFHPQHERLLSQRHQRPHRKPVSWDPYSQIMSDKEKEWIIRLQMIQLQSENPRLDDYYYQECYQRMEAKLAEEEFLGDRLKKEPPKLTTPYVNKTLSYIPVVHIEGSLGQVAVSTCFSPRRAIDAVHANTPDEEHKYTRQQRLEVLSTIEKLYIVLLEVEEADKMKATVSDKDEERQLVQNIKRKVEHLYNELRCTNLLESGEEFLSCLIISKGKRMLARLLPFLSHDESLHILGVVTKHLPVLMSRDTDEALPVMYPSLRAVIDRLAFNQLIRILKEFTAALPDSKDTRLTLACQNKFGLSLLYALLSQGERILSSDLPMEPSTGDFEIWTDTVFHVARQLSQTILVEPLLLPSNLLTLFCRYLDKPTVHQLKNNLESATGFLAVAS